MTTLLATSTATSPTSTEGNVKDFLDNLRTVIAEFLGTDTANKSAALSGLGAILNSSLPKSANYTVVSADRGKVITASSAITLNIQAAATLGDGFSFAVWNTSGGNVTIDPNLTETINGATTAIVKPGKMALIYCNGSTFISVAGFSLSDLLDADGAGSGVDADLLDGQEGSYYAAESTVAKKDINATMGVGTVATLRVSPSSGSATVANLATTAGSNLRLEISSEGVDSLVIPSGTWRNISGATVSGNSSSHGRGLFQRIS